MEAAQSGHRGPEQSSPGDTTAPVADRTAPGPSRIGRRRSRLAEQFVNFASGVYRAILDRWYAFIEQNGGFAALEDASFSNYNTPYLVALAVLTYLPVPEMVAIKALSVDFDLVHALFAYKIVAVLRPGPAGRPWRRAA